MERFFKSQFKVAPATSIEPAQQANEASAKGRGSARDTTFENWKKPNGINTVPTCVFYVVFCSF